MSLRLAPAALLLAAAIAGSGCAATFRSQPPPAHHSRVSVGIEFFYDDLAPYGTWVSVHPHGWVWCPLDVESGWRPYTVGYWIYTEDGWFWISEDPWGWVPYHYGRWAYDRYYGWIWVPGDEWAPAWVAWRYGHGWIGWSPLPPNVHWRIHVGLVFTAFELDRHIDRYHWCFTKAHKFGTERMRLRVEPPSRNVTLLKRSRNVTKYVAGPRPVEEGMKPYLIQENKGLKIEPFRIEDRTSPDRERGPTIRERSIEVYRPEGEVTAVVRSRVRDIPPAERPAPRQELIERMQRERGQLEERVKAERRELAEEQEREMRERDPGVSAMEMRRRQEAELRAQKEIEQRRKAVAEERPQRVEKEREKAVREREKVKEERGKSERKR